MGSVLTFKGKFDFNKILKEKWQRKGSGEKGK